MPTSDDHFHLGGPIEYKRKKTLCIDFDGVIHSYTSGWQGVDVIPDPVVPNAIASIYMYTAEYNVAIFSSRSGQPGGIEAMKAYIDKADREYLISNDLHFGNDRIKLTQRLEFPETKPPAVVYIDDRAYRFLGTYPLVRELKELEETWNAKEV